MLNYLNKFKLLYSKYLQLKTCACVLSMTIYINKLAQKYMESSKIRTVFINFTDR